jgi:hypothetical protein
MLEELTSKAIEAEFKRINENITLLKDSMYDIAHVLKDLNDRMMILERINRVPERKLTLEGDPDA